MRPFKIGYLRVDGDPELDQYYTVVFGLQNRDYKWVKASGIATLKIMDVKNRVLYEGKRNINANDYSEVNIPEIGRIPVVIWDIPVKDVEEGIPDILGKGKAIIYFVSRNGERLYRGVRIPIPKATPIYIENIFVKIEPSKLLSENLVFLTPHYRPDTVFYGEYQVRLSIKPYRAKQITIHGIHVEPELVEIVEIRPEIPVSVEKPNTLNLYLLLKPVREYRGILTITLQAIAIMKNYYLLRR